MTDSNWQRLDDELFKAIQNIDFNALAAACAYKGFEPTEMLEILRQKHDSNTENDGDPGSTFESDMEVLVTLYVTSGTNLHQMCKRFSDDRKVLVNRLKNKYEISDSKSVRYDTVTMSRIAACFPIDVVRKYSESNARVLYNPGEVEGWTGEHRSIFLACCIPEETNKALPGLLAWVLKLQQGIKAVVSRSDHFDWLQACDILKARHTTTSASKSDRVAFLEEIGCATASGVATVKLVRLHNEGYNYLKAQKDEALNLYKDKFGVGIESWVEHSLDEQISVL